MSLIYRDASQIETSNSWKDFLHKALLIVRYCCKVKVFPVLNKISFKSPLLVHTVTDLSVFALHIFFLAHYQIVICYDLSTVDKIICWKD